MVPGFTKWIGFTGTAVGLAVGLTIAPREGLHTAVGQVKPAVGVVVPAEQPEPRAASGLLVRHNPDIINDLTAAARLSAQGDFRAALVKYEALMQDVRDDVFPVDRNRFISVTEKVQQEIGKLPIEGLRLYRTAVDADAFKLYEQGRAGDLDALLKIATLYRHSSVGADAVDLAAARLFDRAEFARAARLWERWLEEFSGASTEKRASVGVQLAVAYVGSGQPEKARRVAEDLAKKLPDAAVVIAGRRVPAAAFAENYLKAPMAVVTRRPTLVGGPEDRPMWPGNPAGTHLMGEAEIVLERRYIDNEEALRSADRPFAKLKSQPQQAGQLPRHIEPARPIPAVVDETLYIRYADRVRALDLVSGRMVWDSPHVAAESRLDAAAKGDGRGEKEVQPGNGVVVFAGGIGGNSGGARLVPDGLAIDRGRTGITVADGRAFTVEGFLGTQAQNTYPIRAGQTAASTLAARDARTGKILWTVGNGLPAEVAGREQTDLEKLIARGTYLTAPTFSQGRLLVTVEHGEGFHAVCLEPADGTPVWSRFISAKPLLSGNSPFYSMGSPPAASGGVAYFLTNAGTLAALDEATGQVQWILQYVDPPRAEPGGPGRRGFVYTPYAGLGRPPNPVVVTGNRVVVLPSDADRVFAVNVTDGSIAWSAGRDVKFDDGSPTTTQMWLAGAADGKVILCAPDAIAFNLTDGKIAWTALLDAKGAGRPALSEKVLALAVENTGITAVRVADGTPAAAVPLHGTGPERAKDPHPLGNLLIADGKIVSCSEVATAAFYKFDAGYERLTRRIADKPADVRSHIQRGELCFRALKEAPERLQQARADFEKAKELAAGGAEPALRAECDAALYQVYFHIADRTDDGNARIAMLDNAISVASRDAQKSEVRLELARTHRDLGNYAKAADFAQELALLTPDVPVDISDRKRRLARTVVDARPTQAGLKLSQEFIAALIAAHGRAVYAKYDAAARDLFTKATADKSAERVEDVLRLYSNAAVSPECLLQLGVLYSERAKRTLAGDEPDPTVKRLAASSEFARATRWLERLAFARDYKDSELRAAAVAGRLAIGEQRSKAEAREWFARLSKFEPTAAVSWPEYRGRTVRDVMEEAGRRLYPNGVPVRLIVSGMAFDVPRDLALLRPLEGVIRFKDDDGNDFQLPWGGTNSRLLLGADGRPVTAEDGVFLLTNSGLCFVKPATGEMVWRCGEGRTQTAGSPAFNRFINAVGAVVDDKLVFWDGQIACAVDIEKGKLTASMSTHKEMGGQDEVNQMRRRGVFMAPQTAVGFYQGLIAYYKIDVDPANNASRYRLKVLDLPNDRAFPEIDMTVNQLNFVQGRIIPPAVGAMGVAAVTGFNTLAVFRPSTGKRIFDATVGGAIMSVQITPDELLIVTTQGAGAYAFDGAGRRLWHVPATGGGGAEMAVVLAADAESVYFSMFRQTAGGGEVVCAAKRDGAIRWRLAMDKIDEGGGVNFQFRNATYGAVADGKLVLLTSLHGWPQPQIPPHQNYQQFVISACVNTADGKLAWKRPLAMGANRHGHVSIPEFTPTQAIISVRDSQTMAIRLNVVERDAGTPIINDKGLSGPFTNGDAKWQRAWQSGFPHAVGSYLLVETPDGVMVWGSR